jgi:polygalacturonase
MKRFSLAWLVGAALAASAADNSAPKIFNIRDYGAKGDGTSFDTAAIQKALDSCGEAGGGTVKFPPGTYLIKPIRLRNRTTVLLDEGTTLLASPNQSDFLRGGGDWLKASGGDFIPLVSGAGLTNVALVGKGAIDGNGKVWWPEAEKARQKVSGYTLPRPNLLVLNRCQDVRVEGIKLLNSPKYHFVPGECENVTVAGVTIQAPEGAANTDGIDPSNCRNVKISHCTIDTGDDNIAIKSGRKIEGREFACENIEVTDCTFKHGHGMSIGSEVVGGVRNVTVRRCTFEDTDNGLRIKSRRERGGVVENIGYYDITMTNVHPAISMVAYYQASTHDKYPKGDQAHPVTATTPVFRNIIIRNVTAAATEEAGLIVGLPESPVDGVLLENVHIKAKEGLTFAHAKNVRLKKTQIVAAAGEPIILDDASVER